MASNDQVRFMPTTRFNGHDAGSSFGTSRANAEAWANLDLGHIEGEEPPKAEGKALDKPPKDKAVKTPPKKMDATEPASEPEAPVTK